MCGPYWTDSRASQSTYEAAYATASLATTSSPVLTCNAPTELAAVMLADPAQELGTRRPLLAPKAVEQAARGRTDSAPYIATDFCPLGAIATAAEPLAYPFAHIAATGTSGPDRTCSTAPSPPQRRAEVLSRAATASERRIECAVPKRLLD